MADEQPVADSTPSEIDRLTALLVSEEEVAGEAGEDQEVSGETDIEVADEVEADEGSEEVEDPTEEPEEETEEEQPQTFEVDGQEVSLDELKLGYLRQSDYTRKTQAAAEQRKAAEAQQQNYESSLQALLAAAGADLSRFQNVNWEGLAVQDPGQYQQAKAMYEQAQSTYNLIRGQAESHMTQMQERAQAELKQRASESLGILKSTIPNWSNDLYYEIGDYAQKELGVSSDEFNNIADHRSITAMWKAMQYDRAKTVTTEKKVKASPQKTLSGSKADANKVNSSESYRKARDNLRKTGSMDAAVQALLNRKG
jgi:hypothetical protein